MQAVQPSRAERSVKREVAAVQVKAPPAISQRRCAISTKVMECLDSNNFPKYLEAGLQAKGIHVAEEIIIDSRKRNFLRSYSVPRESPETW